MVCWLELCSLCICMYLCLVSCPHCQLASFIQKSRFLLLWEKLRCSNPLLLTIIKVSTRCRGPLSLLTRHGLLHWATPYSAPLLHVMCLLLWPFDHVIDLQSSMLENLTNKFHLHPYETQCIHQLMPTPYAFFCFSLNTKECKSVLFLELN